MYTRWQQDLLAAVPTARIVELPGANLFMFLSNEADVLREIQAFAGDIDRPVESLLADTAPGERLSVGASGETQVLLAINADVFTFDTPSVMRKAHGQCWRRFGGGFGSTRLPPGLTRSTILRYLTSQMRTSGMADPGL
jgi:hypothetical protein